MHRYVLSVFLLLAFSGSPLQAEEPNLVAPKLTEAQLALQGTWRFDQCFLNGKLNESKLEYTFIKDNVTVVDPDNPEVGIFTGKYKVDLTKKPHQLDFILPTKELGIIHHKGLYSINKDRLVFCFHWSDPDIRPQELLDKPKAGFNVIILKR